VSDGAVTPRFIVFEGIEGAGKTTQVRLLSAWLDAQGVEHVTAREPGGTAVGEGIRALLLEQRELDVPAETELLLMLAARAAFVRDVVRPALDAGKCVIADRFALSTFAYQGFGRGLPLEDVRALNAFATGGLEPDLYVVLDVPAAEGAARQRAEGAELDRIESEGEVFLDRVRQGYCTLAEASPHIELINARVEAESLHQQICGLLHDTFPEVFKGND
jgi:dTMP kinase